MARPERRGRVPADAGAVERDARRQPRCREQSSKDAAGGRSDPLQPRLGVSRRPCRARSVVLRVLPRHPIALLRELAGPVDGLQLMEGGEGDRLTTSSHLPPWASWATTTRMRPSNSLLRASRSLRGGAMKGRRDDEGAKPLI